MLKESKIFCYLHENGDPLENECKICNQNLSIKKLKTNKLNQSYMKFSLKKS